MDIALNPRGYFKRGDKSPEIIKIQTELKKQGFWSNVAFNENFGPATEEAVRKFQQAKNLKVDGQVGKDTLAALGFTVQGATTKPADTPTPTGTTSSGTGAKLGFDHTTKQFVNVDKNLTYDQSYRSLIDASKMPAPQLTKAKLIDWKLQAEGGLSRNTNDSASSYPCPTPYNGVSGYHTNKGVTYKTWRRYFDGSQANDMRFYAMSHDDWSLIFDNLYWKPNAQSIYPETINCLVVSFAWGGSKAPTVAGAESILGQALSKSDVSLAVAALLSARGQLFINISQPGSRNNGFRIGWISNALNKLVKVTYGL